MAAVNDTRQAQMKVDLGGEQVVLERARITEKLGQPFAMEVDIIATLGEVDLLPHLGKPVVIEMYEDDELRRRFHGLVATGEFIHESGVGFHYRLQAMPFTHWLTRNRDMAIFQDMTAPDIIKKVLTDAGWSDFEVKLRKSYSPREYCVQYRESDFTFITRLMEKEGIYYYWRHAADKHVMVLVDAATTHEAGTPASLPFNTTAASVNRVGSGQRGSHSHYLDKLAEKVSSGGEAMTTLRAWDFKKPQRPLQAQSNDPQKHPHDDAEVYDYHPDLFTDETKGKDQTDTRIAALRRDRQTYHGRTQAVSLACGFKLGVQDHPAGRLNTNYLITQTEHVLQTEAYRAKSDEKKPENEDVTHMTFQAIPAATTFHLPVVTPKPVARGLESAIVSGPAGEEIYTDEFGRVKVRFHWDRASTPGEKSTCFIRIAQLMGLGNIILPRIGEEVFVGFLEDNPDKPVIMGVGFNKANMPIYDLPENKTRALWRTRSYPGGKSTQFPDTMALDTGSPGANELRFEDKSGKEEVFLHAEKDWNTRVRHDSTLQVGHDESLLIGHDRKDEVKRDEATVIGRNQDLTVVGNQTELIKGKRAVEIKATDTLTIGQSQTVDAGTTIEITANTSITLQVGSSKIKITPTGISIEAMTVNVKGQGTCKMSSPMTTVAGSGVNKITGGVVMIN